MKLERYRCLTLMALDLASKARLRKVRDSMKSFGMSIETRQGHIIECGYYNDGDGKPGYVNYDGRRVYPEKEK